MHRQSILMLALIGLVLGVLACNAPTPSPEPTDPRPTPSTAATERPTPSPATETPTASPSPSISPTPTATPTLTATATLTPTPTVPVSTGPLDFALPTALDHWQPLGDGEMEATIVVRITGGAPPYTVYHDASLITTTEEINPVITFPARGCSALVHSITVESADGQTAQHDYWIPAPWCE